jgi:hypothetical protein
MDYEKINKLLGEIRIKRDKLRIEKDSKKRDKLRIEIQITELKIRLERLK